MEIQLKRCSCGDRCIHPDGAWQPATLEYFYKHPPSPDGLGSRCKDCVKRAAKLSAQQNPDAARERKRRYDHSEKGKAQARKNARLARLKDPEGIRAKNRRYYALNPAVFRKSHTPEQAVAGAEARRARKASLPSKFEVNDWRFALEYFDHKCAVCGRTVDMWVVLAADHWIALSDPRPDNPGTVAWNMIPLCHSRKGAPVGMESCCNQSKRNHDPFDWLVSKYGEKKAKKIIARIEEYFSIAKRWADFLWRIDWQWKVIYIFEPAEESEALQ